MYVAITRARKRLYLCHAQSRMLHGQTRYCVPSAFLEEIPQGLLKLLSRARPAAPAWSSGREAPRLAPAASPTLPGGLRVGMNVRHAKFGFGVIVDAKGEGADAKVQVNFGSAGMKLLTLEYAKLDPA